MSETKRLSEEDDNSKTRWPKKPRVSDSIGETQGHENEVNQFCLQGVGCGIQVEGNSEQNESQAIEGIRVLNPVPVSVNLSASEEDHSVKNFIIKEDRALDQSFLQGIDFEIQVKGNNGKNESQAIEGIRVLDPVPVYVNISDSEELNIEDHEVKNRIIMVDNVLGRSGCCGSGDRDEEEEIEKGDVGKRILNIDLNMEQIDLDLNLPFSEGGFEEYTQFSPRLDIIHISSDEGEQVPNEKGARRKGKEIDIGHFYGGFLSLFSMEEKETADPLLSLNERENSMESSDSGGARIDEAILLLEDDVVELRMEQEATIVREEPQGLRQDIGRYRNRNIARDYGLQMARFNEETYIEHLKRQQQVQAIETDKKLETFTGPFSMAMKLVKERKNAQQLINWKPFKDRDPNISMRLVPSLQDLSLKVLAKNADAIVSLEYVPETLKHRLSSMLCDSRKMNIHGLNLLVQGCPTEICIKDCSWITEEQFTEVFGSFDAKNLKVLQLDLCGQCVLGDSLRRTLSRSPNSLPDLAIISLKGACRLTDAALQELVASAPAIQSINLSHCSLLSNGSINILASSLAASLRELYIDNWQKIEALHISPAIKTFKYLEVLSVAGIQTVCDEFLFEIMAECGQNMKELDLADCPELTNISMQVIGNTCSGLCSLNISNLPKLTDLALQYLANGCQSIQTLKLCQNSFSDEAVAAFLETSGNSLKELSLNKVRKIGPNTALSLAKCLKGLLGLDLSWCRKITNEALGLIVDSCLSMKVLKLFGCTQISNEFLNAHSNGEVQIVGLSMTPLLEHLNTLEPEEVYLRYSPLTLSSDSQRSDHPVT